MFMIVETFPKLIEGNYVVDVHNGFERLMWVVVPHQMVFRWKNFWGAELITMEYGDVELLKNVGNQPIKEKIFEHITDKPQTIKEINRALRADGYFPSHVDIKAFIYKLKSEDRVITEYDNRVMTVRTP